MNLWLLACRPPGAFKVGVTVPLPKSADAADPTKFRPITMAIMVCRLFHRLLAHRAGRHLPLGARQKAFREGDGLFYFRFDFDVRVVIGMSFYICLPNFVVIG